MMMKSFDTLVSFNHFVVKKMQQQCRCPIRAYIGCFAEKSDAREATWKKSKRSSLVE